MPTKLKRNADFRAKPKGLCIFIKSLIPIAIRNGINSVISRKQKNYNDYHLPKIEIS